MSAEPHIHQLNCISLGELKAHVGALAAAIDELIILNQQEASKTILKNDPDSEIISALGKPLTLVAEVRRMLLLAGDDGITATEMAYILCKRRAFKKKSVHTSLMRLQRTGDARVAGRRWYPCNDRVHPLEI